MVDRFNFSVQERVNREFGNVKSPTEARADSALSTIKAAPIALPYAAVNTVADSLEAVTFNTVGRAIKFFDTDIFNEEKEKQRLRGLASFTGSEYLDNVADNFDANYQVIKTTTDLALLFSGVGAISKGTQGAGVLSKLGTTNTGRKLFGDFTAVEKAYDDFHTIGAKIARDNLGVVTGAVSTERSLGEAKKAIRAARFNINPRKGPLGASIKEAVGTEAAIFATMNQSEFFFPEGMNNWDYAQMAGFGLGLPVAIDSLQHVAKMKGILRGLGENEVRSAREGLALTTDAVTDDEILVLSGIRNGAIADQIDGAETITNATKQNAGVLQDGNQQGQRKAIQRLAAINDDFGAQNANLTFDEVDNVVKAVNARPENFLGVHSIEKVAKVNPSELEFRLKEVTVPKLDKEIEKLRETGKGPTARLKLQQMQRKKDLLQNTNFIGVAQDGSTFSRKLPDAWDGDTPNNVKLTKTGEFKLSSPTTVGSLKMHAERTGAYAKMPANVETFTKGLSDKRFTTFIERAVEGKRDFVNDDYAVQVVNKYTEMFGKDKANALLQTSERLEKFNVKDVDDYLERLEVRSFQKKADEFTQLSKRGAYDEFEQIDLSRHFNLNLHDEVGNVPSNLALYLAERGRNAKSLNGEALRNDYSQFVRSLINGTVDGDIDDALKFSGSNAEIKGRPVVMQRDVRKQEINVREHRDLARVADETQNGIVSRLANNARTIDNALQQKGAPNLVGIVLSETGDEFSEQFSKDVMNVFAGSERATAGNDTLVGGFLANVLPQDKNFRNFFVSAFQYAAQINSGIVKKYEQAAKDYLKTNEKVFAEIRKKDNFADLTSLNVVVRSFSQGWEFAKGSAFKPGKLNIADSVGNRNKLRNFGLNDDAINAVFKNGDAAMPDVTQLAKGVYQPAGLTPLASTALEFLREADGVSLLNRNAIRASTGKQVVNDNTLSLPSMANKYEQTIVVHEIGTNKIVSVTSSKTIEEALTNGNALAKNLNEKRGRGEAVLVAKPAVQFKAETGQTPFAQGFDVSKVDSSLVPSDAATILDNMLKSIIRDWGSVSADAINARFKKEVNFLEHMEKNLRGADDNVRNAKTRNVYSEVKNRLMGINTSRPSGNLYNELLNGVDNLGDAVLKRTVEALSPALAHYGNRDVKLGKALDDIGKSTGYRPAEDFIKDSGITADITTESLARKMNAVTGFWVLRFAELGQTLLNITTIPTILPTVGKTMARRPKETFEEYRGRIGTFADVIGENAPVRMNPVKLMQAGLHDMFTDEGRKIYQEARKRGSLDASVVETHDIIFEGGRKYADPSAFQKFKNIATTPTDFTEQYARTVSYMAGHRLFRTEAGDTLSDDAIHKLANWFADQNVGDYSKITRPDNFTGGVGSALGLFQTFFTNYWQRFARAIETGDKKTIATQFGTQFAMFGLESVPGYDAFSQAWTSYDGSQTPWESFVSSYGVDYAEILNTGAISNLPKLFGAKDGIALYTRGDTNVRGIPTLADVNRVPAVTISKKLFQGVTDAGKLIKQEGTGTHGSRLLEIAANSSPSRSVKGALEVINGRAVDRNGGLVTDETREIGNAVSRLIGSKPLAEQRAGAMMYRQRGMQQTMNARVSVMRNNFTAELRDNGMSKDLVNRMLERYIDEHRNPATFKQWLKELNKKAEYSKNHRELLKTYKRMAKGQTGKYADKQTLRFYQLIASDPSAATEFHR